ATVSSANDSNVGNDSATETTVVSPNPATTTTISAPAITYDANGVVTVTVSAPGAAPTGNVNLVVDGGAPLTQALTPATSTSSTATFTIPGLNAGDHSLSASYPAQNG